jgi:hypothetical protein
MAIHSPEIMNVADEQRNTCGRSYTSIAYYRHSIGFSKLFEQTSGGTIDNMYRKIDKDR